MSGRATRLWRGEEGLARTFWEYTILYGTLANVAATIAVFASVAANAPTWVAVALFVLPIPYNLFMVMAVWRSAARYRGPAERALLARIAVVGWALIACVV